MGRHTRAVLWIASLAASLGLAAVPPKPAENRWPPQVQVAVRVGFEPSSFRSAGHDCLAYELYVENFEEHPVVIERLDVLDATATAKPVTSFDARQLSTMMHHAGEQIVGDQIGSADDESSRKIQPGQTAIVFLFVESDGHNPLPMSLKHRLRIDGNDVEVANTSTAHGNVRTFTAPVQGGPWLIDSGPGNVSHHRRQMLILDGTPRIPSRLAIDWMLTKHSKSHEGDEQDNHSYFSYGQPVLAIGDATVVSVNDGIPENVPGHFGKGKLAVALSLDTIFGNLVVLDVGGGQYAYYGHLQPGSIKVKKGERVHSGQVIARVGNSGSSFEPHLHFELTNAGRVLKGEGIPYELSGYGLIGKGGVTSARVNELPLDGNTVTFDGY